MKKVITYGTYDLLHKGHIALLERAKALGDYLIVGVTSDSYDKSRGKLNVQQSLVERIEAIKELKIADKIIVEEYEGQKISDIIKYHADVFTVGSDWIGKFDYLSKYCTVNYLERTQGVSSTEIRASQHPEVKLGLIGLDNPVDRFISEASFVKGISIASIYSHSKEKGLDYSKKHNYKYASKIEEMDVDAVYICNTVEHHYESIMKSLKSGFHILCESPMFLNVKEAQEVYAYAEKNNLVVFEALKTNYFPAFQHLILLIRTGIIGEVKDIEVSFSKNTDDFEDICKNKYNGSLFDLVSYALCPIFKILGTKYEDCKLYTYQKDDFNIYTKAILQYKNAISSFNTGKGIKTEGNLVITGTEGYIYVPAPWWTMEYFELRFEDLRKTKKFFYKCEGDGFRYEILEFLKSITEDDSNTFEKGREEVMSATKILEQSICGGIISI